MKKRVLILSLLTTFLFTTFSFAATYKKSKYENFSDAIGTKYEDAVLYLKAFNYVTGYPDGTFKPENEITRAELVCLIAPFSFDMQSCIENNSDLNKFTDVPQNHWAKKHIEAAGHVGIVSGYEDGTFRPDNKVTHAEALTILLNLHGLKDYINGSPYQWPFNYILYSMVNQISDLPSSDDYYLNAKRGDIAIYISNIRNVSWE